MAALSANAYPFTPQSALEHKMLNYADIVNNNNKYYEIILQQGTGTYPFRVYTKYGRVNLSAKEEGRFFNSVYDAQAEYSKILKSKLRKGYVEIELDDGTKSQAKVNVPIKASTPAITNNKVLNLISKLYTLTTSYVTKSIDTPLGKLSANQVAKGVHVLNQIEEALKNNDTRNIDILTNQFYAIIPKSFGRTANYSKLRIDTFDKILDKRELLDVIASVVQVQSSLESQIEQKYAALGIKLRYVEPSESEYQRVRSKIEGTQGNTHHFKIKVKNIFEVQDMTGYRNFNPYNVPVMELFHGTRKENVLGIMQKGILIKPSTAVHAGSMFGAGAYFADCSTKSAQYTDGFNNVRNQDQYFFVCDVATGKIKEYMDAQPSLRSAPNGYHSVKGCAGRSLRYNEYIVFNTNQVRIRYIVEFEKC